MPQNEKATFEEVRATWVALRDEYAAAIDAWGWDDPRTIALEEREAVACDAWIAANA